MYGYVVQDPVNWIYPTGLTKKNSITSNLWTDGQLNNMKGGLGGGGASAGQVKHFQRIFDQGGLSSLLKSRNSILNRYNEHVIKIQNASGFTSSMQRENRNFLNELNASMKY